MEKDLNTLIKNRTRSITLIKAGKHIIKRINDILPGWGAPMIPNYIENDYYSSATKYLGLDSYVDISNKEYLKYLRNEDYIPRTWFENEQIFADILKKYFVKKNNVDNGYGISICRGDELETIVKKTYSVQEEIIPKLINGYKFDIRVLICVCRNGDIFIYDNLLYRFSSVKYNKNSYETKDNITNTAHNKSPSTFFYYKKLETPTPEQKIIKEYHDYYLKQLRYIIPRIYFILLEHANKEDNLKNPENNYYIHGLDFIANVDNKLYFLEINSPPGHAGDCGIYNYQDFLYKATDFITK